MSIGQLILAGNWLIEFNFKSKLNILKSSPLLWVLFSVYFLHLIGFSWSSNIEYALKDSRIKLPLLILPLIISTSKKINARELKIIFLIYLSTILILSLASLYKLLGLSNHTIIDKRDLSIYISHIRYGLNIAFAIFLSLRFRTLLFKNAHFLAITIPIWLIACLFLFELYTGLICLLAIFISLSIVYLFSKRVSLSWKLIGLVILFFSVLSPIYITSKVYKDYTREIPLGYDQTIRVAYTLNGEKYWHDVKSKEKENNVYVERYIAWKELEKAWNSRSVYGFRDTDKKGNYIISTVTRFLSSKGLKKDSTNIYSLTPDEVKAIENGTANVYYLHHNKVENRIHKIFYEIDHYQQTGIANGYSLAMRLVYWKTCWRIIKNNLIYGVGTGDIKDHFAHQYELDETLLDPKFRKRAHNQYLTFWATFGIVGLLLFILSLLIPLFYNTDFKKIYFAFWVLVCLSFISEDTLETQAGVTFFALFNSLFLLGLKKPNQELHYTDVKSAEQ